jgi:hypothetical protein
MHTLLIGYDLNRPGQHYADLIDAIKRLGAWWHHLDSMWLLQTTLDASEVRNILAGHIDRTDELLVVDVTGAHWASRNLSERANRWLTQRVAA